jgi:vancomycin permeability regulator SanA
MCPVASESLSILARAAAVFCAAFSLLSLLGRFSSPGFDGNLWWIDLRPAPLWLDRILLGTASVLLFAWVLSPRARTIRRTVTLSLVGFLFLAAVADCARFYHTLLSGRVVSYFPVPLSLAIAAVLGVVFWAIFRNIQVARGIHRCFAVVVTAASLAIAFALGQMFCFGNTDYRRPADVIVVMGAKTYADGHPSDLLADRVRTACDLYKQGLAGHMIFSGGPGDGPIDEPHAMRTLALRLGVPDSAIIIDSNGLNTAATVRNTLAIFKAMDFHRVLVVSHFYHLPRIKMAYQSQGQDVWTTPALQTRIPRDIVYFIFREAAALWAYYLRAM